MATTPSKLSKLLQQNSLAITDLQRKSADWFVGKVNSFANVRTMSEESLMRGDAKDKTTAVRPGDLYLYIYEAKHAATLPYWDRFPLVFPFQTTPTGFYGLNLHYLPYAYRAKLLETLMDNTTDKSMTETTRLRLKWQTIKQFSQFTPAQVCVKQYLYSQLRSPLKRISPEDWVSALFLPMERFQSASSQEVWRDSVRKLQSLGKPTLAKGSIV